MVSRLLRGCFVFLVACGKPPPSNAPKADLGARAEPATVAARQVTPQGRAVMVGWYCPTLAEQRPAIRPLFASPEGWTSEGLGRRVQSRQARRFEVWGFDGRRSGSLAVLGASKDVSGAAIAIGSYVGRSPCSEVASLGEKSRTNQACQVTTGGCGLASAPLEAAGGFESRPYDEDPEVRELRPGTGCVRGPALVVDVDGDGAPEHFEVAALQSADGPPEELAYLPDESSSCDEAGAFSFALSDKRWVVAVADLDDDGRVELVIRTGEEFWLYAAPNSSARLELVGRAR
jgi:hypothetical protein